MIRNNVAKSILLYFLLDCKGKVFFADHQIFTQIFRFGHENPLAFRNDRGRIN